jgi:hypothetical protein
MTKAEAGWRQTNQLCPDYPWLWELILRHVGDGSIHVDKSRLSQGDIDILSDVPFSFTVVDYEGEWGIYWD